MTTTDLRPKFADGSDLPEYKPGGSLHRPAEDSDDERVHITQINDAELVADLWGVVVDQELSSMAFISRFQEFVRSNYGDEFTAKLEARSKARFEGLEPTQVDGDDWLRHNRRYQYGHTGMIPENWPQSAYDMYE
jgi:hypothetical protein